MASFDENGKYIKTNWKAGDKITATKLNKIEESIEAVNNNDISRYDEMRDKFIILEAKDAEHDKELANVKNTITDNKNDIEQAMAKVNEDVNAFKDDIKNDIQYPINLAGEVKNTYKFELNDDRMMPSLLTLDNIEGQSEIVSNNEGSNCLRTTNIKSICTIDTSKNYLDDAIYEDHRTSHSIDGYNINVVGEPGWSYLKVHIQNLEIGNKYCITLDAEVTSGNSALEIVSGLQNYHTTDQCINSQNLQKSANSVIAVYVGGEATIRLHASLDTTAGDVTYKNIQINKVKEMIVPDIQLNSLPNGVKDEIKDGMLIKRTGIVNLADLKWWCSSDQPTFAMYYSWIPNMKMSSAFDAIDNNILCNSFKNTSTSMLDDPNNYSENVINSHWSISELKIKLSKNDFPDGDLYAWLRNNNVHAVYELETPECVPINLSIKVDKGDTVVINTTKTMDLTYDIQLNTRAQIDALQESVKHSDIIARDLNELIKNVGWEFVVRDVTEGSSAYKVFHYVLPGGLIIQGGRVRQQAGNYSVRVNYSIPFTTECIATLTMGQWSNTNDHYWVAGNTDRKTFCEFVKNGNADKSDEVYWLAIGY